MTAEELKESIVTLGLTQTGLARVVGVTGRAMRFYIAGDREIPEPTARLIRLMVARPELVSVVSGLADE